MSASEKDDVDVFTEAVRLPVHEWKAFLDEVCGRDSEQRQRLEVLLRAHANAGEFLEQHPPEVKPSADFPGEKPGDRIGKYKLRQQIGEGGCGIVFMAEQEEPVRRVVALKVIKPGMDTKTVVARFEAERQALAMMDHPNIAHVLDAGATESGRPFFVMELVRGIKITDYCDQIAATTSERLRLFMQVCDAVQHAHHKGVIHRDIKPSNILVTELPDGAALVKVIDFGIAKATMGQRLTDKTLFTAFGLLLGTPAYMSPEQAALARSDVDTRTDIYSLGVLLYELLTGATPFDTHELLKSGLDEVRRVICNEEPATPSTRLGAFTAQQVAAISKQRQMEPSRLMDELKGDLDWIVMKALEKDRDRRYSTANEFAADVRRFLDGQAVVARPASVSYKVRRFVSRHRVLFGAACALAALLLACVFLVISLMSERRGMRRELEVARYENQGALFQNAEDWNKAADADRQALRLQLKYFGPNTETSAQLLSSTVGALILAQRQQEAIEVLDAAGVPRKYGWPVRGDWLYMRADAAGIHGRWEEALQDATLAVKMEPTPLMIHLLAPLLIQAGHTNEYRRLCALIVANSKSVTKPAEADTMAKDCLILPGAVADLTPVAAMADLAVQRGKTDDAYTFYLCCKALADYRQGRFAEASARCAQILRDPFPYTQAEGNALLAMSNFQMNHLPEARDALARCQEVVAARFAPPGSDNIGQDWRDWVIGRVLLQEAEQLVNPSKSHE